MSKQSRQKQKQIRDKMKAARRTANYLRCGPKTSDTKKKKTNKFKPKTDKEPQKVKTKRGKAKLSLRQKAHGKKGKTKLPLAPLKERRNMSPKEICERRSLMRIKKQVDSTSA